MKIYRSNMGNFFKFYALPLVLVGTIIYLLTLTGAVSISTGIILAVVKILIVCFLAVMAGLAVYAICIFMYNLKGGRNGK